MNTRVHIERLVLDGIALSYGEQMRLQVAVETELGRLLSEGGIASGLASGEALDLVKGSRVHFTRNALGTELGVQVAQAVYGGIGR